MVTLRARGNLWDQPACAPDGASARHPLRTLTARRSLAEARILPVAKFSEGGWLRFVNTYRTMCIAPEPEFRRVLEEIREMRLAA